MARLRIPATATFVCPAAPGQLLALLSMLTPKVQATFVGEAPEIFVPIAGGWGRMSMTHIRLAATDERRPLRARFAPSRSSA